MNDPTWNTIGILGGMGPEATAELYRRIIEICQRDYGAKYDSDFPQIFIYNLPLPDIVESSGNRQLVNESLMDGIQKLESVGCNLIAIPCNTAFIFIDRLNLKIPLVNIIAETFSEAKRRNYKKVGVLCTKNTSRNNLYENVFKEIEILQPQENEQEIINEIILRVLSGSKLSEDIAYLKNVGRQMEQEGAEAIVLGCTELPLLISPDNFSFDLLDTLQILAEATVKKARGAKR